MSDPQIYVRGFPKNCRQSQLKQLFNKYGAIREVRVIRDYAFIVYNNKQEVQSAVKGMDGENYQDYKLRVQIAGKPKKPKGPQPNDQCRYCRKLGHWQKIIQLTIGKMIVLNTDKKKEEEEDKDLTVLHLHNRHLIVNDLEREEKIRKSGKNIERDLIHPRAVAPAHIARVDLHLKMKAKEKDKNHRITMKNDLIVLLRI